MNMTIRRLEICNFKGIRSLTLAFEGSSARISGRNGTGKTSICDAYLWLLFGKDSAGNKPDVKPVSDTGERVQGLESDVRAVLESDGQTVTLRRQLHEVWQKDGTGEKVYVRDETLCWVNDTPAKLEKEYTPFVLGLVGGNENTFRLLTDLGGFMRLPWADRRRELVRLTGADPDAELRKDQRYKDIDEVLHGQSPEDAKKRLMEQRRTLEAQLKAMPVRLDELERSLTPVSEDEVAAAEQAAATLTQEAAQLMDKLSGADASLDAVRAKQADYSRRINTMLAEARKPISEEIAKLERKASDLRRQMAAANTEALYREEAAAGIERRIAALQKEREDKLAQWHSYENMTYVPPQIATTCPTCGQDLPEDRVQAAYDQHMATWEQERQQAMDKIKQDGKALAASLVDASEQLTIARAAADAAKRITAEGDPAELDRRVLAMREAEPDMSGNTEYTALLAEYEAFMSGDRGQDEQQRAAWKERLAVNQIEQDAARYVMSKVETLESTKHRIEEVKQERQSLGAQAAKVERDIDLLAMYVRERCAALETAINAQFDTIRWRLFDTAKNGSLIDCCDATVNGVSYAPSELNTGACVNADIEIIRVLSRAYGVTVPCFVDNAERVNRIAYPGGQRILLSVTEDDRLTMTLEDD